MAHIFQIYILTPCFNYIGMLCGLDGEYLPDCYDGPAPAQSFAEYFLPVVEAYGGGAHGI